MYGIKQDVPNSSDGKGKVVNAFQDLVKLAYPDLKMLVNENAFTEDTIKRIIHKPVNDLYASNDSAISEAESAVFSFLSRRKSTSDRTTLSDIKKQFTKRPYGWYQNAIWGIVAKLYKRGKIEILQNSNVLNDDEVIRALQNNRQYDNTLVVPQQEIDKRNIKQLKDLFYDFFDTPVSKSEAKDIALEFQQKLKDELNVISQVYNNKNSYPFLNSLEEPKTYIEKLVRKDYIYYLTKVKKFEDECFRSHKEILE
jgi:hypothetical protein